MRLHDLHGGAPCGHTSMLRARRSCDERMGPRQVDDASDRNAGKSRELRQDSSLVERLPPGCSTPGEIMRRRTRNVARLGGSLLLLLAGCYQQSDPSSAPQLEDDAAGRGGSAPAERLAGDRTPSDLHAICDEHCGNGIVELDLGEECDPDVPGWDAACSDTCKQQIYGKRCSSVADCPAVPGYSGSFICSGPQGGQKTCTALCMEADGSVEVDPSVCPALPGRTQSCAYPFCFVRCGEGCPDGLTCAGNLCGRFQ